MRFLFFKLSLEHFQKRWLQGLYLMVLLIGNKYEKYDRKKSFEEKVEY